jgi:hypothetical protein
MEVTVECSRRLLEGDVSIVDTRRLFLRYSDGSSPADKFQRQRLYNGQAAGFHEEGLSYAQESGKKGRRREILVPCEGTGKVKS